MLKSVKIIKKDIENFSIKVKPSGEVIINAPKDASDEHIEFVLKKREKWIINKQEFFAKFKSREKELVSGEEMKYLGRSYRLKVNESKEEFVRLNRGTLELFVRDKNNFKKKQKLLDEWYKDKALICFFNIINEFNKMVKRDIKNVRIRKMKTRWGSCNAAKSYINLNLELIKKPKKCVEYVIFHELAHLVHPDHSKKFYEYLSVYMSDWQERKRMLENSLN